MKRHLKEEKKGAFLLALVLEKKCSKKTSVLSTMSLATEQRGQ